MDPEIAQRKVDRRPGFNEIPGHKNPNKSVAQSVM